MAFLLFIVAFLGILGALIVAGVLVLFQWALEGIFRRRVGVYFGYAELFTVLSLIAFILYKGDEVCGRGSRNCIDGGEVASVIAFALAVSLGLIVMPIILVSTLRLSKWAANRTTFEGYRMSIMIDGKVVSST